MKTIADLLARDLSQTIEEIIKVDQADQQTVYTELTEYIATDRLKSEYRHLLRAIADAPQDPHEGVGVWVSGFFGSGKSSFVKNLGYVLANQTVLGHQASDLFKTQLNDTEIAALLDSINSRIPTEVIMFDISKSSEVRRGDEKIAEVIYRAILSQLGYALDYDIAELEIELEAEGHLDEFVALCPTINGQPWQMARKGAKKLNYASAILHHIQPDVFPQPDSWARSLRTQNTTITVDTVVERTFELASRRRPGQAVAFVIDEVGQYAARSDKKIEDLRALVESFGKESKNRLKARRTTAPVWVIVTSQEKLEEVVSALDSRRVELARLQDRFKYRIDLAPADIREVATRRVLTKTENAEAHLRQLYRQSEGQLNTSIRLERTTRHSQVNEDDFVQFYPYLPHYIELSIDIMSGIRLQPGAQKHLGGSNRTIIKQAYEMLVSERTALARQPIGTLVTLDNIYELVEGNLSTEKQKDISDIQDRFANQPDRHMMVRVAKVLALLEFVRDLPRTETNIAACLVERLGQPAPLVQVETALQKLADAQFVRNTEEGWKLQTAQEKNWESERRSYLEPKPKDRNDIMRQNLQGIFDDPKISTYRHKNLRNFRIGLTVNSLRLSDGQIPLTVIVADDDESFPQQLQDIRNESRQPTAQNNIYWVFSLNKELDDLVANLYASQQMVNKYEQMRAQNKISSDELACLQDEHNSVNRRQRRMRDKLIVALENGQGVFRGRARDATALGKTLPDILRNLFANVIPDLYPRLEIGARSLKGTEPEEILKAANLNGLSQLFYGGENGLDLVRKEGSAYVLHPNAEVSKEVMDYLNQEHGYGNRETRLGRALEDHFGGLGYGWERDMLRLVLAVLFRAGAIEVSYQGQRYDSYDLPSARTPLINNTAFKSSLFTPVKPLELKTLTQAVKSYEELTGQTVDPEKSVIAAAFKKFAEDELRQLVSVRATVQANNLPVAGQINDYYTTLDNATKGIAEEAVRLLAGEGKSLKEARDQIRLIHTATSYETLDMLSKARTAAQTMWLALATQVQDDNLHTQAKELREMLASATFYNQLDGIKKRSTALTSAYEQTYRQLHQERASAYNEAIEAIKGQPEWLEVPDEMHGPVLKSLTDLACNQIDLPPGETICHVCRASLGQMKSDLLALGNRRSQIMNKIQELIQPDEIMETVHLADFFAGPLTSEEAIVDALERLRQHLQKLLDQGIKIIVE
jgi:hypothetical protein